MSNTEYRRPKCLDHFDIRTSIFYILTSLAVYRAKTVPVFQGRSVFQDGFRPRLCGSGGIGSPDWDTNFAGSTLGKVKMSNTEYRRPKCLDHFDIRTSIFYILTSLAVYRAKALARFSGTQRLSRWLSVKTVRIWRHRIAGLGHQRRWQHLGESQNVEYRISTSEVS